MTDNLLDNPKHLVERLRLAGEELADLKAAARLREEMKKPLLAKIKQEQGDKLSDAKAETIALADVRYAQHVTDMVEAQRQADRAAVRYLCGQEYLGLIRTLESSRRAEMQLGR